MEEEIYSITHIVPLDKIQKMNLIQLLDLVCADPEYLVNPEMKKHKIEIRKRAKYLINHSILIG